MDRRGTAIFVVAQAPVRYALVRIWAVVCVGLLAGVLGDVGAEFFAGFGWLGGVTHDIDHQGVLPALAMALTLTLGLVAYMVGSRIAPNDPLLRRLDDARARALDAAAALAASCVTVVTIELFETHFGGLAPFDAHSILATHAPILILSFVTVAVGSRMMLGSAIRCAARGGAAAVALLTSFLRIARSSRPAAKHLTMADPNASRSYNPAEVVRSRGLRAPPHTLPVIV